MRVMVSVPMVKFIKKALPEYAVSLEKYSMDQYRAYVDYDVLSNETDWNYETSRFKVIRIGYPANYYAMPRYLTTRELNKIFSRSDKTADGFISEIRAAIEI